MGREIAVFVGEDGNTASFYAQGKVVVFRKKRGEWDQKREKPFTLADSLSIRELRERMSEVVDFLESCRTFTGLSVVGVPFFELEKAGCSVWEVEGNPLDFLDYIHHQEEEAENASLKERDDKTIEPVETKPGYYFLSLSDVQNNNLAVTSKQALIPFLRKGEFYELEVACEHIPLWLEGELLNLGLIKTLENVNGAIRITIVKKCCEA